MRRCRIASSASFVDALGSTGGIGTFFDAAGIEIDEGAEVLASAAAGVIGGICVLPCAVTVLLQPDVHANRKSTRIWAIGTRRFGRALWFF